MEFLDAALTYFSGINEIVNGSAAAGSMTPAWDIVERAGFNSDDILFRNSKPSAGAFFDSDSISLSNIFTEPRLTSVGQLNTHDETKFDISLLQRFNAELGNNWFSVETPYSIEWFI